MFQRGGAFSGHYSEGGASQAGGGAQICGAAEETVRLQIFVVQCCGSGFCVHCVIIREPLKFKDFNLLHNSYCSLLVFFHSKDKVGYYFSPRTR